LPHVLILVPDPLYPEPFAWAFHVEADALRAGGFEVTARPWTAVGDLTPFDAVLPLVAWGYHERYNEWLALLGRIESEGVCCINPPAILRWNSDKAYLAEMDAGGVPTVHTIAVDALDEHALREARDRFACERLVVKPPISASATGTFLLGPNDTVPGEAATAIADATYSCAERTLHSKRDAGAVHEHDDVLQRRAFDRAEE